MLVKFICTLFLLPRLVSSVSLNNGLARTPPMGWMSGERFACNTDCINYPSDCISERLIKSTADAMVSGGFLAAGYSYLAIDDCWMDASRDSKGRLQADQRRFPSGMAALSAYIHKLGLKLGLYIDIGTTTCGGFPGSQGHYALDAQTLANWSVDMVKVGACGQHDIQTLNLAFPDLGRVLNNTGRPMLYLCLWPSALYNQGTQANFSAVKQTCNQYRSYDDVTDNLESLQSIMSYYSGYSYLFLNNSGPGSFNDPDQLIIGDFGLSVNQDQQQMALWSIMSAPLFISADLRLITTESKAVLFNRVAISIDQDPLGIFGQQIQLMGEVSIWLKATLPPGSFAFAIFYVSISGGPSKVSVKLSDLGLVTAAAYNVTEAFTGQYYGAMKPWYTLNCEVNPVGVMLFNAVALP